MTSGSTAHKVAKRRNYFDMLRTNVPNTPLSPIHAINLPLSPPLGTMWGELEGFSPCSSQDATA